jgi:hypothetical protein
MDLREHFEMKNSHVATILKYQFYGTKSLPSFSLFKKLACAGDRPVLIVIIFIFEFSFQILGFPGV